MSEAVYFSNGTGQWEEDTPAGGEISGGSGGGAGGGGGGGGAPNIVTVTSPGPQTGTAGAGINLQIAASDSDPAQTLTFTATGLPSGLSISASGKITGTIGSGGTFPVTVTAADSTGASATASFTWTVTGANTVTVANPGPQTGTAGAAVSLQISASDSASGQTLTFTATGLPAGLSISASGKITGNYSAAGNFTSTVTATDTTGAFSTATFGWTVNASTGGGGGGGGTGLLTYLGYTPGQGTGETGPGNLTGLSGWQAAYQRTGPGAPTGTGRAYALCTKIFDPQIGYPNFPAAWGGNPQSWAANNGGVAMVPIIVFDNIPSVATIKGFLQSLPAGQKCAFQYQSEMEGGLSGPAFVSGSITISQNLNTALSQMGSSTFWNRANFPIVTSSLASFYGSSSSTAYYAGLAAHVDSPGLDMYHRNIPGSGQSVPVNQDPRFKNWIAAVHSVFGANVPISFPEYGISFANNAYSASNETARAALLKADFDYLTGSSRPSGTKGMMFWNYWYQMDTQYQFCFPLADGSETVNQAGPTIAQWQAMLAKAG